MSTERDTTRLVRSWLEEGVTALPDRVLDAVLDQVPATAQLRRFASVRRSFEMHPTLKYALAAAAAVIVAVVAIRLTPGLTGPGGPFGPSPSPTPGPSLRVWDGQGTLDPGRWAMDVGDVRVSFDIPDGWQENVVPDVIWHSASEGRFGFHLVDNLFVDPCDSSSLREPPVGPTVDNLAAALASLPGIEADGPTDVTFGGLSAKLVEISLAVTEQPCGADNVSLWPASGLPEPTPLESGARARFWILDVQGTRLVVYAVDRDAFTTVLRNEMQQILDSVRFEP